MKTKIILKIDNVIRVVDLEIVIPLHTKKLFHVYDLSTMLKFIIDFYNT